MITYSFMLILLTGLFLSCERDISNEQADRFIKFYGNYLMDRAGDVEVLDNGTYAICGTETTVPGGKRMVLILTDKYGNMQGGFPKYYTMDGLETGGTSLIALQGGSGGFVLTGFIERPVAGSQSVQKDIFLVRTSATGEETWQRSYGTVEDEYILHAIEAIRPGYMLAGYQVNKGKSDILIMGVSEEGDSIDLSLNNSPYAQNAAASFLLNAGDKYICVCTSDKLNNEGASIQILSFDDELSPLVKNLSGSFDEYGTCIIMEDEDQFLVLGNRIKPSGHTESVIYRIETSGLLLTNTSLFASIAEENTDIRGRRILEYTSGRYAIAGSKGIEDNSMLMLQFVSEVQGVEDKVCFGATGDQTCADLELSDDGGFILLGNNDQEGNSMISLLKTSATGELK